MNIPGGGGPRPWASLPGPLSSASLSGPRMLWKTGWTESCGPLCLTLPPHPAPRLPSGEAGDTPGPTESEAWVRGVICHPV